MSGVLEWIRGNETLVAVLGVASVLFFAGSIALLPLLVARIPADYFAREAAPPSDWASRHPLGRLVLLVARNVLGTLLILVGLALLVLPGQGILTLLLGFLALDVPGKRGLELRILRRRRVLRALNWMRRRAGREPLRVAGVPPDR